MRCVEVGRQVIIRADRSKITPSPKELPEEGRFYDLCATLKYGEKCTLLCKSYFYPHAFASSCAAQACEGSCTLFARGIVFRAVDKSGKIWYNKNVVNKYEEREQNDYAEHGSQI